MIHWQIEHKLSVQQFNLFVHKNAIAFHSPIFSPLSAIYEKKQWEGD